MMTLTTKIVQPFIATLEEALHYKVTITDTNGYIVGSPARLNQFHPSAYEILCERQPIESWDIATDSYVNVPEGVQLGYGERVIYDGECIGLIGLVGAPEEIYASGVLEKVFQVRVHSVETAKGERQYLFSRL